MKPRTQNPATAISAASPISAIAFGAISSVMSAWATRQGVPILVTISVRNTLSKRRPILAQVKPIPAITNTGRMTALN